MQPFLPSASRRSSLPLSAKSSKLPPIRRSSPSPAACLQPHLFPVKAIGKRAGTLREQGAAALQYATTEGFAPLRQFIADRYLSRHGMAVNPDNILITSGSQALDLLGKVLVNEGQDLIIEEPGYLGAIQAFSVYQPNFKPITLAEEGLDLARWMRCWSRAPAPGCSRRAQLPEPERCFPQPRANREALAERLVRHDLLMVEDDPWRAALRGGEHLPPSPSWPHNTVLLGPSPRRWCRLPPGLDGGAGLAAQEGHHRQAGHRPAQQRLQPAGAAPLP